MDLEYGDVLEFRKIWRRRSDKQYTATCRFRIDPVPNVGRKLNKKWFYSWHKKPRTTQERRMSLEYPEFTRSRRNFMNLPNTWDDILRGDCHSRHCWKNKKIKKQWMKGIRKADIR